MAVPFERERKCAVKRGCAACAIALVACFVCAAAARAADQCGNAGPWCNQALSPDARAQLLLEHLTEAQKIGLLTGDDLLGVTGLVGHTGHQAGIKGLVPPLSLTDGTAGIRQGPATAVPVELALAASFDPSLARLDGVVLGDEARDKGNDVIYAPTLTIMRTPLAGRTFQAFGEDPFLTSQLGDAEIEGIQSTGVIANANIFVANNQEGEDPTGLLGMPGLPLGVGLIGNRLLIDANVSQRALREIYLPPFRSAVQQAHVGTVICAYNLVNGVHNCENGALLNGVLKREWGFKGIVISDYGAALNTVASMNGGLDFEPWPGLAYSAPLVKLALDTGQVSQATLDDHVERYLRTLFAFGVFERPPFVDNDAQINKQAHAADAQRMEEGAITLLRNQGRILPLDPRRVKSIAVIGREAGSFITGGGSSNVTPFSTVTPLQGIQRRAAAAGVRVSYANGTNPAQAVGLARSSSVAVVVATNYEIEGADLQCLTLECPDAYGNQDSLIDQVAAANPNTIVVLETGGPVLTPWRNRIRGLLEAWYPGESGGTAIARVLFGDVDPSGHLPVTFPAAESQEPTYGDPMSYPGIGNQETYKEGVFVGYRWFDEHGLTPAYPFGFGLSYTTFRYSQLRIWRARGGERIAFTVKNTGSRVGAAVAQLYLGLPSLPGVPQPPAQLKGFRKVTLAPGHRARISLWVSRQALSYWNGRWQVAPGCYRVMVGSSSRDTPLRGIFGVGIKTCRR